MNRHFSLRSMALVGLCVTLAVGALAQRASNKILIVNGVPASGAVLQMRGRSYVDITTLAEITNGSVTFQGDRIILTMPGSQLAQAPEGLSKDFATAALVGLAEMREWKSAVETMITFQVSVVGNWIQDHHDRAEESLRLANVAASTPSDQHAFQLLQNEFTTLAEWAGNAVAAREALNATRTVNPNFLREDPTLAKISNCANFLSTMLVSGRFAENPACH